MKKITVLLFSLALTSTIVAQQATKTDSIYLTLYNTGGRYLLKRAAYGEQAPKTELIKDMVLTKDSFVIKLANEFVSVCFVRPNKILFTLDSPINSATSLVLFK